MASCYSLEDTYFSGREKKNVLSSREKAERQWLNPLQCTVVVSDII